MLRKNFIEYRLTTSLWVYLKLPKVFKIYCPVIFKLFHIIESQSFQLKPMEENPPVFAALLLFKAWQNFKCKILLFPKQS